MRRGYPDVCNRVVFTGEVHGVVVGAYGKWFLALLLYAAVMGVIHVVSISSPNEHDRGSLFFLYTVISVVLASFMLVNVVARSRWFSLNVCWALYAVSTCASLGVSLFMADALQVALTIFASMRYIAFAFLNIKLVDFSHHAKLPPHIVFVAGWGGVQLFMALGISLTLNVVGSNIALSNASFLMLMATVIMGLLFVFGGSTFSDVRIPVASEGDSTAATLAETVYDIQYRQCQVLRARYGLTERETEVAFLITQGYTQTHCADALMVSLNTVRTHMKHIYSKLDIHTKDELLRELASVGKGDKGAM